MHKKPLENEQMSSAAFVEEATDWARALVRRECRGPGDIEPAMRRLEARYGLPYSTLWRLRYRKPKDIMVSIYARLQAAYLAECDRQQRLLRHERTIAEAKTRIGAAFTRASDALADESATAIDDEALL